ncbi:MAG: hypothetical protein DRH30_00540 [Deltaproteobacteria bacterium]|nr:MAG: hypothetical protein DRH30_00540 [Deltaproteobacteria bacterium]
MSTEPLYSIAAIFTSMKVAVISVITVVAISMEWDSTMTAAVIGAGSAITLAIGDIVGAVLTHDRVTPVIKTTGSE